LNNLQADALELIKEAAKIAQISTSSKIAEATLQVVDAMVDDGLVSAANIHPYALVMNEMIASGALRLRSQGLSPNPELPLDS
jgi:hypothetical protein